MTLLARQVCAAGPRPLYVAAMPLPPAAGLQTQAGSNTPASTSARGRALSGGAIAGIAIACLVVLGSAAACAWRRLTSGAGAPMSARARAWAAALPTHGYALLTRLGLPSAALAVRTVLLAALHRPTPP